MEQQLLCHVYYTYDKDIIPDMFKCLVEERFLEARSEAIKLLNPRYEEWNAEYNKKVSGEDDMEYNAYIQNKQNEVLSEFNKTWSGMVKIWADEYGDIYGKFKYFDEEVAIHMSIKLLE